MLADRLKQLIGQQSTSAFARKVKLNESLIRKYLSGSDPSLSKAVQICEHCGISLNWFATGSGGIQADELLLKQAIQQVLTVSNYEADKVFQQYFSMVQSEPVFGSSKT